MVKLRITKEFGFEMAHMLDDYEGRCSNLHGHSYRLLVSVEGERNTCAATHDNGMVMDFGQLKNIVNEEIIDRFDHSVTLWTESDKCKAIAAVTQRVNLVGYRPTSENLVCDFAERIAKRLPANVKLCSVKLYETATSCVEWINNDN